ncbi:hypothetical protein M758_2G217900 [Ceratodon purpureus]|nr:hypothetical protein M758_2G217900 [Ceratodon purpureus]
MGRHTLDLRPGAGLGAFNLGHRICLEAHSDDWSKLNLHQLRIGTWHTGTTMRIWRFSETRSVINILRLNLVNVACVSSLHFSFSF